jgi:hypothetical protein
MKLKDKRTKLINEVLNGIKVLKLNAWESAFEENIANVRDKEISTIRKAAYITGGMSIIISAAPTMVIILL